MRAVINEYNGCFEILLEPENMEEQTQVVRMGLNATKTVRAIYAGCTSELITYGCVVVAKKKKTTHLVKSR